VTGVTKCIITHRDGDSRGNRRDGSLSSSDQRIIIIL
jgi:hypothetical protein